MKVLLTFTGFHDPYSAGLIGGEEQPGPILSLATQVSFDKIILFSTPNTETHTDATRAALYALKPNASVEVIDLPLDDPTDYSQILKGLRKHIQTIRAGLPDTEYYISVASGTPQMHACWLLLAASGEIPARILHVRPPRFVTKERPLVSLIDLTSPDFPIVKPNLFAHPIRETPHPDMATALLEIGIVADHPSMQKLTETAAILAPADVPVLLLGETGTGKELLAKLIHRLSNRSDGPFVPVNCAAIPGELAESILLGHKKGSFTGAVSDQTGKFDAAHSGTLFLDEIGDLPLSLQSKLLRVLQDGMVEPLGSNTPRKVDVRVIAATNRNIHNAMKSGTFREDLYYRLAVGEICLPPLRERQSDISKIALYILERVNESLRTPKRLSVNALRRLEVHLWPGNVRQLGNVIERSARLSGKVVLEAEDLMVSEPSSPAGSGAPLPEPKAGFSLEDYVAHTRSGLIKRALELAGGSQSEAGRLLGISPQAVHKFVKKGRK